jgi:hypothetical protein
VRVGDLELQVGKSYLNFACGWSDGGNGQDSGQASRERVRHFLAGTLAGAAGVFVGHPFDTVKVQ